MIALVDMADKGKDRLISLSEISERQGISLAYLEQLFVKLRRAEIVESVRGPGGGGRRGLRRPRQQLSFEFQRFCAPSMKPWTLCRAVRGPVVAIRILTRSG